uniref:Protein Vpu n=1 Tax=Human immunodeficiency virus type 1 TaxID=11676 RepID=Q9DU27_HV1|nr:vpu protein [Human immunodeficiency virus 1]
MLDLDYTLAVGALIVALIIAIVVWTIVYIEYRRLVNRKNRDWLLKRIRERAEDSGNESEGDTEELSTMVDMGR